MTAAEIGRRFKLETAAHEMTVLHHDGLYRRLRWANPRSEIYRFDLITWPHNLVIRGDGPNFMFTLYPTQDLFESFRRTSHSGIQSGINPGYWSQKTVAGRVMSWSKDKFRTWLVQEAAKDEARYPGLVQAVAEQILHSDEHSLEYEESARHAVACFVHDGYRLRFPERWEQNFEDYDWSFLWACHAIVWGIAQYDAAQAAGREAVAS